MHSYVEINSIGWQEVGKVIIDLDSIKAVLSTVRTDDNGVEIKKHRIYFTDELWFDTDDEGYSYIKQRLINKSYSNLFSECEELYEEV